MINISIYNPEKYDFDERFVISEVEKTIQESSDLENVELSVAVVPHKQLLEFARLYFDDESEEELNEHPVLSFPSSEAEGPFIAPPDNINHIGEIVVSWEKAGETTNGVVSLANHGALHLLGIHHE